MLDFFQKELDGIFASRQAIAKQQAQTNYQAILKEYPSLAQDIKLKKALELEIAKCTALKKPCESAQSQLDTLTKNISDFVSTNKISLNVRYHCPKCKDTGFVANAPCQCMLDEYNKLLRENASLTPLKDFCFADNAFDKMSVPQAKGMNKLYKILQQVCDKFSSTKLQNFLFSGASGVGKTCLATAFAKELLARNISVLYLSSFELVNIFLDKHTNKSTALKKKYDYVLECECLIIDNLGTEPIYKNVTIEYLLSTIDKRMASAKKTLICTQLDGQALINRYGESLLSKFADKKYALSVGYILGDDLRNK